ncbi:MAG: 7-cyano-7-deazaguanine synthase [Burkholderiaceae bacterium]|nr:7-cyano-7-deazaguanine synthase [Burkholderiaceae bacterium]
MRLPAVKRALLLSGGLDSLAIAHWLRPELAVTIDYGQLAAAAEIVAATQICRTLGIDHHVVSVDCRALGSGDMAGRRPVALAPASEWWPYRNQLLITLAAMWAIPRGVGQLLIGTVASDGSHADGRPVHPSDQRPARMPGGGATGGCACSGHDDR